MTDSEAHLFLTVHLSNEYIPDYRLKGPSFFLMVRLSNEYRITDSEAQIFFNFICIERLPDDRFRGPSFFNVTCNERIPDIIFRGLLFVTLHVTSDYRTTDSETHFFVTLHVVNEDRMLYVSGLKRRRGEPGRVRKPPQTPLSIRKKEAHFF